MYSDVMSETKTDDEPVPQLTVVDQQWISSVSYAAIHAVAAGFLITSGIIAAFAKPTLVGGISFSINFVATGAYALLTWNRFNPRTETWKTRLQRTVIRSVDWLCTFPLLQLELLKLLGVSSEEHAGVYIATFGLAFLTIFLDAALRVSYIQPAASPCIWWVVQAISSLFFLIMIVLLISTERTIAPENENNVPFVFVAFWFVYPIIAFAGDCLRWFGHYDPEFAEDAMFSIADVISKAGIAFYVTYQ